MRKVVSQIAPAIANSQLYAENAAAASAAQRLARQNAALAEIGRVISSSLEIEEVYALFADQTFHLIPFDRISINLIREDIGEFMTAYVIGTPARGRAVGETTRIAGTFTEQVIRNRHAYGVTPGFTRLERGDAWPFPRTRPRIRERYQIVPERAADLQRSRDGGAKLQVSERGHLHAPRRRSGTVYWGPGSGRDCQLPTSCRDRGGGQNTARTGSRTDEIECGVGAVRIPSRHVHTTYRNRFALSPGTFIFSKSGTETGSTKTAANSSRLQLTRSTG